MCGIVGYIGPKKVVPLILDGLRRLEYRGYDSAGIAVVDQNGKLEIRRASGKLRNLEEAIRLSPLDGTYGIGHTRWATHGRPTEENAHPHRDCTGDDRRGPQRHHRELHRAEAPTAAEGHKFVTETDTEVVAHLVEKNSTAGMASARPLEEAVRLAVQQLTRRLCAGLPLHQRPQQDRRRAMRSACRDRPRRGRILRRQRYPGDPLSHARHLLSRRR